MPYEARTETLEYRGYTHQSRVTGWWCAEAECAGFIIDPGWLKFRERGLRHLRAKVECLNSWHSSQPDEATILGVQNNLDRLGATCRVAVKRELPGRWETAFENVPTFEAALDLVPKLLEEALEVAIFLGGSFIWSSIHPDVAEVSRSSPSQS